MTIPAQRIGKQLGVDAGAVSNQNAYGLLPGAGAERHESSKRMRRLLTTATSKPERLEPRLFAEPVQQPRDLTSGGKGKTLLSKLPLGEER
jgi:hypothetical protein